MKTNGNLGKSNGHSLGETLSQATLARAQSKSNGHAATDAHTTKAEMDEKAQTRQEIGKALEAHRRWKERLQKAVDTGASDLQPSVARLDNQCEFGKWLHYQSTEEQQSSKHFARAKELHAAFHQEAGHILELALKGRKSEAHAELGIGKKYAELASALFGELMGWYQELHNSVADSRGAADKGVSLEKLERILNERAKALTRVNDQQTGATTQLVVFVLANERYGIPIEYIAEVQPLRDVTPVPCTPNFVVGVINIRGSIYSVIDIRSMFGVPPAERTEATKVILVKGTGMELGILADDVQGAASVLLSEIKPALTSHAAAKEEYIQGVTQDMMTILNLDALMRDDRIIVREEVA